jgi:hypothetical protein
METSANSAATKNPLRKTSTMTAISRKAVNAARCGQMDRTVRPDFEEGRRS